MADAPASSDSRLSKNSEPLPIKALFQSPQQARNSSRLSGLLLTLVCAENKPFFHLDVTEEIFLQAQIDEHLQRAKQKLEKGKKPFLLKLWGRVRESNAL